jgi:hypothetical protein
MGYKARTVRSKVEPAVVEAGNTQGQGDETEAKLEAVGHESDAPIPVLPLHETIRRAIQVAVTVHPSLRAAARALEMPPSSLRDKLDQFGINMPGSRPNRMHPCQPAFTMRSSRGKERVQSV